MTVSRAEQEVVCGSDRVLAFDLVMDLLADNKVESGDYFIKQQLKNKWALSPDFTI